MTVATRSAATPNLQGIISLSIYFSQFSSKVDDIYQLAENSPEITRFSPSLPPQCVYTYVRIIVSRRQGDYCHLSCLFCRKKEKLLWRVEEDRRKRKEERKKEKKGFLAGEFAKGGLLACLLAARESSMKCKVKGILFSSYFSLHFLSKGDRKECQNKNIGKKRKEKRRG